MQIPRSQKKALWLALGALILGAISLYLVLETMLRMKSQPSPQELREILNVWFWPLVSIAVFTFCLFAALVFQQRGLREDSKNDLKSSSD